MASAGARNEQCSRGAAAPRALVAPQLPPPPFPITTRELFVSFRCCKTQSANLRATLTLMLALLLPLLLLLLLSRESLCCEARNA